MGLLTKRWRVNLDIENPKRWHVTRPALDMLNEVLYQNLFAQQCANLGIKNDFFPVGAAANYTMLYLLARLISEFPCRTIMEFGSGQSTLLIDRIRSSQSAHTAVEHDPAWHALLSTHLSRCEYLRRDLGVCETADRVPFSFYKDVPAGTYEVVIVDGPHGTERFSRLGCVPFLAGNAAEDFVVVLDDFNRSGEQQTAEVLLNSLRNKGLAFRAKAIHGAKSQLVIVAGKYRPFVYCW